ncbi:MAG: phosphoribosyltransferase family protein [candidate division WOR-3 bacterium]
MNLIKSIFELLVPSMCPICERETSNGICCEKCFIELNKDFNDFDRIKSLGVAKALAVFVYSDRVKKLIEVFKYDGFLRIGKFFVELLAFKIEKRKDLFKDDAIIVPIPTHNARIRERGFDHTEFLAKELSKITGIEYKKLLFRARYSKSQTKSKDRWENVNNIFIALNIPNYKNRQIILLDDVITSGSTMINAIKVLQELGYNDIICLSVAFKL